MEVVGRHALLFDDDSAATFVNSQEALVEWNSLLIDRYDVRHLLHTPPPLLKRRRQTPADESEIDHERYLDLLQPQSDDLLSLQQESNSGEGQGAGGTYSAVGFSYGNSDVSADQKNSNSVVGDYGFRPPFPVPENLLQSLPPTEKLHQIMARTALFVSKHGGQSEIVLRVKQGDNPTFGFLMPDHQLHAYFRFLVDHPEILKSEVDSKPQDEDKKTEQNHIADISGGALSLLGSVYESGEEEDDDSLQDADKSADSSVVRGSTHSHVSERVEDSPNLAGKDVGANDRPFPSVKEAALSSKKNRSLSLVPGGKKMDGGAPGSSSTTLEKPVTAKIKPVIVDPPSDMKRTMDKLIEFIVKNGKEFEAVLIEQDAKNGRFPFLLPSNLYHPYYLNILQEAQELKQSGKISSNHQKIDSSAQDGGKKAALSKKNDIGSSNHDLPYDSEKKEKFKMVISGRKKDVQDPPPKPAQEQLEVTIDGEAAAAILQVATRGVRNPRLDMFPKKSLDDSSSPLSGDVEPNSSFGNFSFSSRARSSTPNPVSDARRPSTSLPVDLLRSQSGRSGEKTTFVSVATEADSSEACLTKEQKQKAERLKRAKMFAAMIKGGAAPRLSAEPPDSVNSGLQGSGIKASSFDGPSQSVDSADILVTEELVSREREGSSIPADGDAVGDIDKFKRYDRSDDYKEKQLRKKHHYRSRRLDEDDKDDDDEREHKHSRKKHRSSRHSSHRDRDEHGHRKRHSSSKDRESRHRQKHHSSSEDEQRHRKRSHRHRRESHSERKGDYEEGEISNGDSAKRDAYTDLLQDRVEKSSPLVVNAQPSETTEIPNDLRAKVRAMLLAIQ
ncbi:splicing factor, suppressor of white-apricot homolog isoform X1 [Papaver somniferum]|uniref:splicing factor, suppressor of white-apricot homolog isoform X1 n=2 Tax=Papaver somniferum TaxID=3469 RepID=UPI000E703865|nr:splicing factor, suppressor of white-apricot homolog isoform X1 [Papaver somniferum]